MVLSESLDITPQALEVYGAPVGQISRFFGIEIHMRYRDHPPAHFHVRYAENRATIAIETMQMTNGTLPARVYGLVAEWGTTHQALLRENWQRALARRPLLPIPPLE